MSSNVPITGSGRAGGTDPPAALPRPGRIGLIAIYLVFAALVARTLTISEIRPLLPRYLALEALFVALYTAFFWLPDLPVWLAQLYFLFQSGLVLAILSLWPEFDFVVVLFVMLNYQAALFFDGRLRWAWVAAFVALTGLSLVYHLGLVQGLSLALTTMAAEIVIPAFLITNRDLEQARLGSERLLEELQETRRQLELYAGQAEEMAAFQERNRLARELHDNVSQLIFSISLTARSAELLLDTEAARVPELVDRLADMTAEALSRLRSLIAQLHPPT